MTENEQQPTGPAIMRYFNFLHLREPLQGVSAEFAQLAQYVVDYLPAGDERDVALRRLLESKDAAVRAALDLTGRGVYVSPFQTGQACCSEPPAGEQVLGVLREPRVGEVCCGGGPVAASGEATFREGSAGGCCRDEQPAPAGEEGPDHG